MSHLHITQQHVEKFLSRIEFITDCKQCETIKSHKQMNKEIMLSKSNKLSKSNDEKKKVNKTKVKI